MIWVDSSEAMQILIHKDLGLSLNMNMKELFEIFFIYIVLTIKATSFSCLAILARLLSFQFPRICAK